MRIPYFSGLVIIAILASTLAISNQKSRAKETEYLVKPLVSDLYVVDMAKLSVEADSDYPYAILKVVGVDDYGVRCVVGRYSYSAALGAEGDITKGKVASGEYFDDETVHFDLDELQELRNTSTINSVKRVQVD